MTSMMSHAATAKSWLHPQEFFICANDKTDTKFLFKLAFTFIFSIQFNSKRGQAPGGPTQKALAGWAKNLNYYPKVPRMDVVLLSGPAGVCLQIIFYDLLSENATKRKIRLAPPHAISQWLRTSRRRHRDDDGLHWSSRVFSCQVLFTSSWVVNRYQVVICAFLKDLI